MPKKQKITYLPGDGRYNKPFKYLKKHDAYLVTLQTETHELPGLTDVVPGYGDRALPKGVIWHWSHQSPNYRILIYKPGHAANIDQAEEIGESTTLDEAVEAILSL